MAEKNETTVTNGSLKQWLLGGLAPFTFRQFLLIGVWGYVVIELLRSELKDRIPYEILPLLGFPVMLAIWQKDRLSRHGKHSFWFLFLFFVIAPLTTIAFAIPIIMISALVQLIW